MINSLHSVLRNPQRGWDPIPEEHARLYAEEQWKKFNPSLVDYLANQLGGLEGKRILDLGGGPGQFSVAFALHGAVVTWHDISRRYLEFTAAKAHSSNISIQFSLGYLEESEKLLACPFDLVFCRICWRYCRNDRRFAQLIYRLTAPGGAGYVETTVGTGSDSTWWRRAQFSLNAACGLKIGHPFPPRGRVSTLMQKFPLSHVDITPSASGNERIFFVKRRQ